MHTTFELKSSSAITVVLVLLQILITCYAYVLAVSDGNKFCKQTGIFTKSRRWFMSNIFVILSKLGILNAKNREAKKTDFEIPQEHNL